MRKFNIDEYKSTPQIQLILQHYNLEDEIWPIAEAYLTQDSRLLIRVPETGYSVPEVQIADGDEIRDRDQNLVGYIRFLNEDTSLMSLKELAEKITKIKENEEIHFKIHPDRDLWGITRIRKFECEILFLSYFNGVNMSIFDTIYGDETPENILTWVSEGIEVESEGYIYPIQNKTITEMDFQKHYKENKDDINSSIMEIAGELAEKRILDKYNLPPEELTQPEAPDDPDGCTIYKEQYQDEFNGYYDEEYEKVAKLMGFDYDAENGIRIPEKIYSIPEVQMDNETQQQNKPEEKIKNLLKYNDISLFPIIQGEEKESIYAMWWDNKGNPNEGLVLNVGIDDKDDLYIVVDNGSCGTVQLWESNDELQRECLEAILEKLLEKEGEFEDTAIEKYKYSLWLKGEADLYILSITNFRKSDETPSTGCDDIYYSLSSAQQSIEQYIMECDTKPNAETYTEFLIRFFNPPVEKREVMYPNWQSIFDLSEFDTIRPIVTRKI